ncbi:putative tetratricopeptide-like helical domain-containing protein [Tanacetum coccineum]
MCLEAVLMVVLVMIVDDVGGDPVVVGKMLFKKLVREKLCEPNEVMYRTVINGLCKVGKTSKALELVRFMAKGSYKPQVDQYNMIIDGLCKDNMVDQALELFDKMIEKGITYNSLIHGLCNFGREGEAAKLLTDMEEKEIYPNTRTYNILLK